MSGYSEKMPDRANRRSKHIAMCRYMVNRRPKHIAMCRYMAERQGFSKVYFYNILHHNEIHHNHKNHNDFVFLFSFVWLCLFSAVFAIDGHRMDTKSRDGHY